jgi:isoleucyl-tRNA synthetase
VKLNFRETGKLHGKLTNEISKALERIPIQKAISEISKGSIRLKVEGKTIKLSNKELIVTRHIPKGLRGISRSRYILYLDPEENKDMLVKGYTRELTRKIQDLRKRAKLRRADKIVVQINVGKELSINDVELKKKTNTKEIQFNLKKPANPNLTIRNTGFLVKIKRN